VSWLVLGLFGAAVAVLIAAEWPRVQARLGARRAARYGKRRKMSRRRQRSHLVLVEDEDLSELDEEREAFAESVVRDLERLPTIEDRD
jgi:hypothetical protein